MINSQYAYDYVYEKILEELREKGRENMPVLPSEKEYCEKFGVSLTTVRRALDRLNNEKIIVKMKGQGSVIADNVRCLKFVPNKFIGVLMVPFDDIQGRMFERKFVYVNPYAQKIYKSVYNELKDTYDLLIDTIGAEDIPKKFPISVLSRADKILLLGETRTETISYLHSAGKCVVVYNFFEKGIDVARVNGDERLQYKTMTEWLIANGHKRIASINGINFFSESIERYMGFQEAMIMSDIYLENRFIKWGDMTPESGYCITKELLALPQIPTAIVCVNDGVAMGACDAITEAGLTVGKDVVVTGHDNYAEDGKYAIPTIDPDYDGVGKQIAAMLRRETWLDEEIIHAGKPIIR